MNSPPITSRGTVPDDLARLLSALVDGTITTAEQSDLEALLLHDRAARDAFRSFIEMESILAWEVKQAVSGAPSKADGPSNNSGMLGQVAAFAGPILAAAAAAAAFAAVMFPAALGFRPAPDGDTVARIVSADAKTDFCAGDRLEVGRRIDFESGEIVVQFDCGALATLNGPCSLEIESSKRAFLERGQVRTLAENPKAKGFTIRTVRSRIVDLGTEFVTSVAPDGHSRVDVLSGEVLVHLAGSPATSHLRQGEMMAIEPGGRQVTVRIERGDETPEFRFATIEPPSAADYADVSQGKTQVALGYGRLKVCESMPDLSSGAIERLVDGRAQGAADAPLAAVFFEENGRGAFLFDLGRAMAIRKVNSFSWHRSRFASDNSVRATQKYTLWGYAGDEPPSTAEPSMSDGWDRIARINTDSFFDVATPKDRPAQQACSITSETGSLGRYRFLLFTVEPTPAAHDDDIDHTLYGEIDIYADQ